MSNSIIYRSQKGSQLTSNEVDGNFRYLDERVDKLSEKDYFIYDAGFSRNDQVVTINSGTKWKIGGVEFQSLVDTVFTISRANWTYYRVDAIVVDNNGLFSIVSSEESSDGYVIPRITGNYLTYLYVYVSDAGIQNMSVSVTGDFVSKLSYRWIQTDLQEKFLRLSVDAKNFEIVGGNQLIDGKMNVLHGFTFNGDFPDGLEVSVRNKRSDYMTIVHASIEYVAAINLYTLEDYFLRPNEVIVFKYVRAENKFIVLGGLDVRLSWQNVDDIIGTDSLNLFIDSSEGDTIAADNMQTTLTASVERYFKDFTNQVVSWQWFRESGDTQEDRDSDAMWAIDKTNRIINLTTVDFTANIYNRSVTFTCQAIVNNELIEAKTTIG